MKTVAVIGAGITGITTAYELARRGLEVTVYDRHRYPAMETSYANGGHIAASDGELWTRWRTIANGLRWMLQREAPLRVSPWPGWHKASWFVGFIGSIPRWRGNTLAAIRAGLRGRDAVAEIADREGIDFAPTYGLLHLCRTEGELAAARAVGPVFAEAGVERREVGADEVRTIEPALPHGYVGGFYCEPDLTGDLYAFAVGLARACERLGVEFRLGAELADTRAEGGRIAIRPDGGERRTFDATVVCAGVGSRALARRFGDRVNVYPVKGYSITVDLADDASRAAAPRIGLVDDTARIVTSRLGDRLRIAGTAEFDGMNRDIRARRIRPLIAWCEENFPGIATEHCVPWTGLRPMTPSMLPRVGPGRAAGVYYNTGHGHLGWTATATARDIADLVKAEA